MHGFLISNSQNIHVLNWVPHNLVDNLVGQLILSDDFARSHRPNDKVRVLISASQPQAIRRDSDSTHTACVEVEVNTDLLGEGLQIARGRQLRNQLAWVANVNLFLEEPRAHVKVEAALKVFFDQVFVQRNLPESIKLLWQIVKLTI